MKRRYSDKKGRKYGKEKDYDKRFYAVVSVQLKKDVYILYIRYRLYNHCGDDSAKVHLFSFRTQKLSFAAPKVLAG